MPGVHAAAEVLQNPSDYLEAADFERRCWPAKVVGAGLTTYMVSIEPSFAERLFDADLAGTTLFAREPVLGLSREHVYYCPPTNATKNVEGPGRVLWYVKQRGRGHPVGHVRAVSHLVDVVRDRPRTLYSRYARLGAYTQEQVESAAQRTGRAMAMRLTDTEVLNTPVSLGDLREIWNSAGHRFQAPQSPIRVHEHMFCLIYRQSSLYAR
jgi:hypothetical protein